MPPALLKACVFSKVTGLGWSVLLNFGGGIFSGMLSFFLGGFSEICLFLCKDMNRPPRQDVFFFEKTPLKMNGDVSSKLAGLNKPNDPKVVFRFFTNPPPSN